MALQDLTPQLRTRLSRMERAVGWFVILAVGLLAFGFVYYVYNTAARKGWFLTKAPYYTFVRSAAGLKVGDPVMMMGFGVGSITEIQSMPGDDFTYNVCVRFQLKDPYYDYMWTEGSYARVAAADFLGKRGLEVTKGTNGYPTYIFQPLRVVDVNQVPSLPDAQKWLLGQEAFDAQGNHIARPFYGALTNTEILARAGFRTVTVIDAREPRKKTMTGLWEFRNGRYEPYTNKLSEYWLLAEESPAVSERLESVMGQVERALPGVFALTNQLANLLATSSGTASNLSALIATATPAVSNIAAATAHLDQPGSLGQWLIPTNINSQLQTTLASASGTMDSANTNLAILVQNLSRSLDNLAGITSNLNTQVQANTNLILGISQAITHADELVQGLKRHWLFRSAFKNDPANKKPEPKPSSSAPAPLASPKARGESGRR